MPIRIAIPEDLPGIMALARETYAGRDTDKAEPYIAWAMQQPDRLCLIGVDTAGMASVTSHYGFERKARMDILVGRRTAIAPLEAFRMVKIMVDWAEKMGAKSFRLDADTGVDFGPFALRLGGHLVDSPRYDIPLNAENPDV